MKSRSLELHGPSSSSSTFKYTLYTAGPPFNPTMPKLLFAVFLLLLFKMLVLYSLTHPFNSLGELLLLYHGSLQAFDIYKDRGVDPDMSVTPQWAIRRLNTVHTVFEDSVHYGLDDDDEWQAMIPDGGLLSDESGLFSIGMFHELRCLDFLRRSTQGGAPRPPVRVELLDHCLNYLRQTVLCRADMHLDSFRGRTEKLTFEPQHCRDWRVVYEEVKRRRSDTGAPVYAPSNVGSPLPTKTAVA